MPKNQYNALFIRNPILVFLFGLPFIFPIFSGIITILLSINIILNNKSEIANFANSEN